MHYTITNQQLTAVIDEHGAELCSLKSATQEYIWQGSEEFWSGHSPLLFPIIGSVHNNQVIIGNQTCQLRNHGFLQDQTFMVEEHTTDKLVLVTRSTPEVLAKHYPFAFQFQVTFTLCEMQLHITYDIVNLDSVTMSYCFGLHPALNCNIEADDAFEDYYIEFDTPTNITRPYMPEDDADYIDYENLEVVIPEYSKRFDLKHEHFLKYSLIQDRKFQYANLRHKHKGRILDFAFTGFDTFTMWQPHYAPFICLEPWTGISGILPYSPHLESNKLCQYLAAGETRSYSLTMTCHK